MPVQDLTPQLRTRLNPLEKIVGWFILAATALMVLGFAYYLYRTAEQRGWFEVKALYCTYSDSGAGLAVGDPVQLMGFSIGRITRIMPMPPRGKGSEHNVQVEFLIIGTNYSYIWTGNSRAKFVDSGFLGKRQLDITKGTNGYSTYINYPVRKMSLADIKSSPHLARLRLGQEVSKGANLECKAWGALATNLELEIHVCHFPPGTSKWNKIEHRMFCQITQNWRGRPLTSRQVVVNLIGQTTTKTGLRIKAALDEKCYPIKQQVSDAEMAAIKITRHDFHREWNYLDSETFMQRRQG